MTRAEPAVTEPEVPIGPVKPHLYLTSSGATYASLGPFWLFVGVIFDRKFHPVVSVESH